MIVFLNKNLKRICEITQYKSIIWHPMDPVSDELGGDFEFELPTGLYDEVETDYFVYNSETPDWFGVVKSIEKRDDEDGTIVKISGVMGGDVLSRRVIYPQQQYHGWIRSVVSDILKENFIAPKNINRKIENFYYESASDDNFRELVNLMLSGNTVANALKGLCLQAGCTYRFRLVQDMDGKFTGFSLRLVKGTDLSEKVIFDDVRENVSSFRYAKNVTNAATHAIVGGGGDGVDQTIVQYPDYSTEDTIGLGRKEVFVDKSNLTDSNGKLEYAAYIEQLKAAGVEELKKREISEVAESDIAMIGYEIGTHFNISDIVTISNSKISVSYTSRVLGVVYSYAPETGESMTVEIGNLELAPEPPPEEQIEEIEGEEPETSTKQPLGEGKTTALDIITGIMYGDDGPIEDFSSGYASSYFLIQNANNAEFHFGINIVNGDNPVKMIRFILNNTQRTQLYNIIVEEIPKLRMIVISNGTAVGAIYFSFKEEILDFENDKYNFYINVFSSGIADGCHGSINRCFAINRDMVPPDPTGGGGYNPFSFTDYTFEPMIVGSDIEAHGLDDYVFYAMSGAPDGAEVVITSEDYYNIYHPIFKVYSATHLHSILKINGATLDFPNGIYLADGTSITIDISPVTGYRITNVTIAAPGTSVTTVTPNAQYTIAELKGSVLISIDAAADE